MKHKIFAAAIIPLMAIAAGCNTPYNNMKTADRLVVFRQECIGAGYGAVANQCAAERNKQFEQLRNNQIFAGIVVVAAAGGAVAYCANHNCGGGSSPGPAPYPGNCQYDWQTDAAGHRCGARSAYSRPGGY